MKSANMAGKGYLTTHILDTSRGCPAQNIRIDLYRIDGENRIHVARATSNKDGRTDAPLVGKGDLIAGIYELVFTVGAYFQASVRKSDAPFLDVVPVRFGVSDEDSHYHVPLLVSPFSYSTYRGS